MADYDLFQIEISRNYTMSEWREDIKRVRCSTKSYSLSTLSQKSETVAVVSPFSATVSLFCDSVDRALVFVV